MNVELKKSDWHGSKHVDMVQVSRINEHSTVFRHGPCVLRPGAPKIGGSLATVASPLANKFCATGLSPLAHIFFWQP